MEADKDQLITEDADVAYRKCPGVNNVAYVVSGTRGSALRPSRTYRRPAETQDYKDVYHVFSATRSFLTQPKCRRCFLASRSRHIVRMGHRFPSSLCETCARMNQPIRTSQDTAHETLRIMNHQPIS